MQRVPVESSNIASVGYDGPRYLLEIEFVDGSVYQYARVPSHLHEAMMQAESKGGFFHRWIRDQYPTTKVPDPDPTPPGTRPAAA